MQLAQGLKKPHFESGGNCTKFSWEWKRYWKALNRRLPPGVVVGYEEKLDIFDSCLSSGLRHLTQYLFEGEEDIAFEHVFPLLEKKFGKRVSQQGRLDWENLALIQPSHGKISLNDMRTFRIDFFEGTEGDA